MPAVQWVLNIAGNFQQQAAAIKASLAGMGQQAGAVAKQLNSNQLISQVESVASIFIQFGGIVSQAGILVSTMARPLSVLNAMFGSTAVAAGLAVGGLALFTVGVFKATSATMAWLSSMAELRGEFIEQGKITSNAALNVLAYEKASDRLEVAIGELGLAVGDVLAPAFTELKDAGTGFVRILEDIVSGTDDWKDSVRALTSDMGWKDYLAALVGLTADGSSLGKRLVEKLAEQGDDPGPAFLNVDPRQSGLLRPLQDPSEFWRSQIMQGKDPSTFPLVDPSFMGPLMPDKVIAENLKRMNEAERQGAKDSRAEQQAMEEAQRIYEENLRLIGTAIDNIEQIEADGLRAFQRTLDDERTERERLAKLEQDSLDAFERRQAAESQRAAGLFMQGFSADSSVGSTLAGALGGPAGMIAGALIDGTLGDMLQGHLDKMTDFYQDLPDVLRDMMRDWIPDLIAAAPDLAAAFATLAPEFAWALVETAPELFSSVVDALADVPERFAEKLMELPEEIADAIGSALEKGVNPFDGNGRGLERAVAGAGALVGGGLGFIIGGPAGAGVGASLGASAGRGAVRAVRGDGRGGGSAERGMGGNAYTFNVTANDPEDLVRQIKSRGGSTGFGWNLDPYEAP